MKRDCAVLHGLPCCLGSKDALARAQMLSNHGIWKQAVLHVSLALDMRLNWYALRRTDLQGDYTHRLARRQQS